MINLRPAKSVQGKVDLPASPDLLFMTALGACAAGRKINIGGISNTEVVSDIIRALQSHASIGLDGSTFSVDPKSCDDPGILLVLPESLLPYRAIYLFMGLGMGKTVAARSMPERQMQDFIALGKRVGITVESVQIDDTTGLRATYFDSGIAESANISEDDCTALLAFLFGKGEKLTFTIGYHLSTPLRQLAHALGFTVSAKLNAPGTSDADALMAKRMRFLRGKQRDTSEQSQITVVEADFTRRSVASDNNNDDESAVNTSNTTDKALNLIIPGDEILAAALISLKCLIPKGDLDISNAPLETWASQTSSFVRKMGSKTNTRDESKTSFGARGTVSVKKAESLGRKVSCIPLYQYTGQLPCMTIAAAFAVGKSVFRDLGALRLFEPDGLDQLEKSLRPLGVRHGEMPDGIVVEGAKDFDGFDIPDPLPAHIAVAFCVAGLKCLGKTSIASELIFARWPNFEAMINEICEFRSK